KADHIGLGIFNVVFQQVVFVDVQFVADRRELAVTQLLTVEHIEQSQRYSPALGNYAHSSAWEHVLHGRERRCQTIRRVHYTDTIGAYEAQIVSLGDCLQLRAQFSAHIAEFTKAAAFDDDAAYALASALLHNVWDSFGRSENHSQIYWLRYFIEGLVDFAAEENSAVCAHKMDHTCVSKFK